MKFWYGDNTLSDFFHEWTTSFHHTCSVFIWIDTKRNNQPAVNFLLQWLYDSNWRILFSCSVDDGFPTITFHFEDDLALHVYPHEYFFPNGVTWHFSPGGSVSVSCTVFLLVFLFSENSLSIPYQTSRLVLFDWFLISSVCPWWERILFNSRAIFFCIKVLYQTTENLLKYL